VSASVSDGDMNDDRSKREIEFKKENFNFNNQSALGKINLEPLRTPTLEAAHSRKFSCDELINHTENCNNNMNTQVNNLKNEQNYG